jgi:double-strand break repair protein MRE11
LETAGYLNQFGRLQQTETQMRVEPILFIKNGINIALYGIAYMKDIRLKKYLCDKDNRIVFVPPEEIAGSGDAQGFYKILVMHQNRNKGHCNGAPCQSSISWEDLPKEFFNLIIWGHEHDARPKPEWVQGCQAYVFQPGSTVATSLSKGESLPKLCGILKVYSRSESNVSARDLASPRNLY